LWIVPKVAEPINSWAVPIWRKISGGKAKEEEQVEVIDTTGMPELEEVDEADKKRD
jgi:hypothetical protein